MNEQGSVYYRDSALTSDMRKKNREQREWKHNKLGVRSQVAEKILQDQLPGAKLLDCRPTSHLEAANLKIKLQKKNPGSTIEVVSPKQMMGFRDKTFPPGSPDRPANDTINGHYYLIAHQSEAEGHTIKLDERKYEALNRDEILLKNLQELLGPKRKYFLLAEGGMAMQLYTRYFLTTQGKRGIKSVGVDNLIKKESKRRGVSERYLDPLRTSLGEAGFDPNRTFVLYQKQDLPRHTSQPSSDKPPKRVELHNEGKLQKDYYAEDLDHRETASKTESATLSKPLSEREIIEQLLDGRMDAATFGHKMNRLNESRSWGDEKTDFSKSLKGRDSFITKINLDEALLNLGHAESSLQSYTGIHKVKLALSLTMYRTSLSILQSQINRKGPWNEAYITNDDFDLVTSAKDFQDQVIYWRQQK